MRATAFIVTFGSLQSCQDSDCLPSLQESTMWNQHFSLGHTIVERQRWDLEVIWTKPFGAIKCLTL